MNVKNNQLLIVCAIGLVVRLLFLLVGAKVYFGRDNIFVDADTAAWASSFVNLWHLGSYTFDPGHEYGYFGRMPGYSFFIGIFYLLTGKDLDTAYVIIGWFQVLLDVCTIALVYKIALRWFGHFRYALVGALLYALYPFAIVWTPVAYSETVSLFLMMAGLYMLVHTEVRYNYLWCGALLGLGALFRPQLLVIIPVIGVYVLFQHRSDIPALAKHAVLYGFGVLLTFGPWPLRNYINHDKFIITQDLRGFSNWNVDVLAYLQYIYSVKAEWEPQFSQIIENKPVDVPRYVEAAPGDSAKFAMAIALSKTCGSGFSHWRGYWKEQFAEPNCNAEIEQLFVELRNNQIAHNPFNFYVRVPLQNLQKAVFKIKLTDTSTTARKVASLLFLYRTLLIVTGLIACVVMLLSGHSFARYAAVVLGFFVAFYLMLCAGTSPQMRNIEMRYFLHADVLMLFPAAWLIASWTMKKQAARQSEPVAA